MTALDRLIDLESLARDYADRGEIRDLLAGRHETLVVVTHDDLEMMQRAMELNIALLQAAHELHAVHLEITRREIAEIQRRASG